MKDRKKLKSQGSWAAPSAGALAADDREVDQGSVMVDFSIHFGRVFDSQRLDRQTSTLMWRTLAHIRSIDVPCGKKGRGSSEILQQKHQQLIITLINYSSFRELGWRR